MTDHRHVRCFRCLHCSDSGGLYGFGGIISIQLILVWSTLLCRDGSSCCLPPYSSEQRKQGIQESPTSWLLLGILLQDLAPERAFADFVLCNLVLHLVIINFLG
ncbi:hypothetical protein F2Q68_00000738 [Brassica cretica]|uniref:Dolichyl-diphosphooligosaccharide--protein glycosyltransferase subunit DAD1 n=1 Tax=Brassica cretica TaxID=69181 RepID=A0A8S9JGI6_BRACR|nr:hypothetical protein F2Q68_00000738 [Brassica cretica]